MGDFFPHIGKFHQISPSLAGQGQLARWRPQYLTSPQPRPPIIMIRPSTINNNHNNWGSWLWTDEILWAPPGHLALAGQTWRILAEFPKMFEKVSKKGFTPQNGQFFNDFYKCARLIFLQAVTRPGAASPHTLGTQVCVRWTGRPALHATIKNVACALRIWGGGCGYNRP